MTDMGDEHNVNSRVPCVCTSTSRLRVGACELIRWDERQPRRAHGAQLVPHLVQRQARKRLPIDPRNHVADARQARTCCGTAADHRRHSHSQAGTQCQVEAKPARRLSRAMHEKTWERPSERAFALVVEAGPGGGGARTQRRRTRESSTSWCT